MSFPDRLAAVQRAVQERLDRALADAGDLPVAQAMRYAVSGGKRIRAFLVMESATLHGVPDAASVSVAAAIEAMHAYSLVHDDLPCMDDDDLRRGLPTVHVKWGQATAVLAGDALQSLAFALLADPAIGSPEVRLALIGRLADCAGIKGMVLGQAMDIAAETAAMPLTLDQISALQVNKTGALIVWAAAAGAVIAGQDDTPLSRYAGALGLAFQIADDILDVTGDAAATGKRVGKDAQAGKATFVSLLGLTAARAQCERLLGQSIAVLVRYGPAADRLRDCARYVVARDR